MVSRKRQSVAARFSNAAGTYNENADVQLGIAQRLSEKLEVHTGAPRILEVGCGTGLFTECLLAKFPDAQIFSLDISKEMVDVAKQRLDAPYISWIVQDFMDYQPAEHFDLIVSSTTFQWLTPLTMLFEHVKELLAPNGVLAFSIMTDGTLKELQELRAELFSHNLPRQVLESSDRIGQTLRRTGFKVLWENEDRIEAHYPDALSLFRNLHDLGVTGGEISHGARLLSRRDVSRLVAEYDRRYGVGPGVIASYQVGYFGCALR